MTDWETVERLAEELCHPSGRRRLEQEAHQEEPVACAGVEAAGDGEVKPRCHNREPFIDPHAGWRPMPYRAFRVMATPNGGAVQKPVLRYRWPWFTDRCATWDGVGIGQPTPEYPTGTPYPIAHGWDCSGCQWKPEGTP